MICHPNGNLDLLGQKVNAIPHKPLEYPGRYSLSAILMPPKCLDDFDIIHCPTVAAPFFFKPNAKVVMTVHDLIPLLFPQWHILRRRLYFKFFLNYRFRFVDQFIAVSAHTKKDLIRCFGISPQKISVVHEGAAEHFSPGNGDKQDYFLAVGTIEPRKNLRRIIKAFLQVREKTNPPHKLLIAGAKGWNCQKDIMLMKQHWPHIEMLGYVPDKNLPELYRRATCLIYPSLYEGFGLPVIEAMACGCPVITSNLSSLPEIAGDAAIQINPYNTDELAGAMIRLAGDQSLQRELANSGLKRSTEFTWDHCARQTLAVYEKALMR